MIDSFTIDGKRYARQHNIVRPYDRAVCWAYVADDGEIFGDYYVTNWSCRELNRLHELFREMQSEGHEVVLLTTFQDVRIRPLDIVRWIKDPTWVGIVTEGNEKHFSVNWFDNSRAESSTPYNAWHNIREGEIEKIANLPDELASAMAHPSGGGAHKPYDLL